MEGKYGRARGVALGAGLGEATWAAVAFYGFGSLTSFIEAYSVVFQAVGSVVLCVVGLSLISSKSKPLPDEDPENKNAEGTGVGNGIAFGWTLSAFNPALLATYTGALSSLFTYITLEFTLLSALTFAAGVCSGVNSWFNILIALLFRYKKRVQPHIHAVCLGFGLLLLALGLMAAWGSLRSLYWRSESNVK